MIHHSVIPRKAGHFNPEKGNELAQHLYASYIHDNEQAQAKHTHLINLPPDVVAKDIELEFFESASDYSLRFSIQNLSRFAEHAIPLDPKKLIDERCMHIDGSYSKASQIVAMDTGFSHHMTQMVQGPIDLQRATTEAIQTEAAQRYRGYLGPAEIFFFANEAASEAVHRAVESGEARIQEPFKPGDIFALPSSSIHYMKDPALAVEVLRLVVQRLHYS